MGAPAPAPWLPPWDERVVEGLANVSQPAPGIAHWFAAGRCGPSCRQSRGGITFRARAVGACAERRRRLATALFPGRPMCR
jgi:hypothetical protein